MEMEKKHLLIELDENMQIPVEVENVSVNEVAAALAAFANESQDCMRALLQASSLALAIWRDKQTQ